MFNTFFNQLRLTHLHNVNDKLWAASAYKKVIDNLCTIQDDETVFEKLFCYFFTESCDLFFFHGLSFSS